MNAPPHEKVPKGPLILDTSPRVLPSVGPQSNLYLLPHVGAVRVCPLLQPRLVAPLEVSAPPKGERLVVIRGRQFPPAQTRKSTGCKYVFPCCVLLLVSPCAATVPAGQGHVEQGPALYFELHQIVFRRNAARLVQPRAVRVGEYLERRCRGG